MGKLELEELELENYFRSFYKKRINHKDFQLSTASNLKKCDFRVQLKRRFM
jgi:hypothetical protein